jgi:hypothetical protein
VLLWPSPESNTYIATIEEYKDLMKAKKINGTYAYRLLKYRKALL